MVRKKNKNRKINLYKGLTLLEMVIALAMIVIIITAILPQLKTINDSWASKQANAEILQNARVLVAQINRSLSSADTIIDVSDPCETNGYIEFEDNTGTPYRFDIAANNYIEYGPVGSLSDLAGPVSQLKFTCYSKDDFTTPTTVTDEIRFVKAEIIFPNPGPGMDKTFTTSAYLRSNFIASDPPVYVEPDSPLEFNVVVAQNPVLEKMDNTHYLCAYAGPGEDGWATVVTVNTSNFTIIRETPFEYDIDKGNHPALAKINSEHYLCVYNGSGGNGWAVILIVDTSDWSITRGVPLEFDTTDGQFPALAPIDSTHFLCVYQGAFNDGWAVVFNVDTTSDTVSLVSAFEFDPVMGKTPTLLNIAGERYLCVYESSQNSGWASVLEVDPVTFAISELSEFAYNTVNAQTPALVKLDNEHFLCAYSGIGDDGYAVVLTVDAGTSNISNGTVFNYDLDKAVTPDLAWIENDRYFCVYEGPSVNAWSNVFTVDTDNRTIIADSHTEYDPVGGKTPCIAKIVSDDNTHFLCVYQGSNNDGWAVILNTSRAILP